jgi:glucose uptake protein GlcU
MLSSIFGLLSALSWGSGDFAGGIASRRSGVYRAAFYGEATGIIFLAVMMAFVRERLPSWTDLGLSAVAGMMGSLGLLLLYRSLQKAR